MAANVEQVQLRGRYRQVIDQDRGRLIDAFENDDADYIAVSNTLDIKHPTSRRRGKNLCAWLMTTLYLNIGTDER